MASKSKRNRQRRKRKEALLAAPDVAITVAVKEKKMGGGIMVPPEREAYAAGALVQLLKKILKPLSADQRATRPMTRKQAAYAQDMTGAVVVAGGLGYAANSDQGQTIIEAADAGEIDVEIKNPDEENYWIIDPIDGTTNFLHGIPHFAISIALRTNNEIISGLIFDPIKNEMFYAEKNSGAYFNNQRIRVSKKRNLNECLFATGGKDENTYNLNTRKSGSAALDLAYVAAGRLDGYWERGLNSWDIAAGILLVKEAGGLVESLEKKIRESTSINVAATEKQTNEIDRLRSWNKELENRMFDEITYVPLEKIDLDEFQIV